MSISFHCESCKKRIKAPDNAGGKWGNCPFCNHRCYIPLPKAPDEEELTLAPVDPAEQTQMDALIQETKMLTQSLLSMEMDLPEEKESDAHSNNRTAQEKEIIKKCIIYLRQMADTELKEAEHTFSKLKKEKKVAIRVLSAMARAERPEPELADLPEAIVRGLIRDTCTRLS